MASSSARVAANRQNAQKSTGPRSDDGKRASARNAVRHGLSRKDLDPEVAAQAAELAAAIQPELPEQDFAETLALAEALLRRRRVRLAASAELAAALETIDPTLPHEERRHRAWVAASPRLVALQDYDARAFSRMAKLLRRIT